MRWAAWSGASQTMVMREVSVRSDSPTVSETMLMLRRRKSEATRVRTPCLSWTRATKVWSMSTCSDLISSLGLRLVRVLVGGGGWGCGCGGGGGGGGGVGGGGGGVVCCGDRGGRDRERVTSIHVKI